MYPLLGKEVANIHTHPFRLDGNGFSSTLRDSINALDPLSSDYTQFFADARVMSAQKLARMQYFFVPPKLPGYESTLSGRFLGIDALDVLEFYDEYNDGAPIWAKSKGSLIFWNKCNNGLIPDGDKRKVCVRFVDAVSGKLTMDYAPDLETAKFEECVQ